MHLLGVVHVGAEFTKERRIMYKMLNCEQHEEKNKNRYKTKTETEQMEGKCHIVNQD